jgi:hypothetical protein
MSGAFGTLLQRVVHFIAGCSLAGSEQFSSHKIDYSGGVS